MWKGKTESDHYKRTQIVSIKSINVSTEKGIPHKVEKTESDNKLELFTIKSINVSKRRQVFLFCYLTCQKAITGIYDVRDRGAGWLAGLKPHQYFLMSGNFFEIQQIYFEVLDMIVSAIKERFEQPCLSVQEPGKSSH